MTTTVATIGMAIDEVSAEEKLFELAQRKAKVYSESSLVPKEYQKNVGNVLIAQNMATRMGADVLMVMQNLYLVHGRPGWSAQFLIGTFNSCGRFSAIRYRFSGKVDTDDWGCTAYCVELSTQEELVGTKVTIGIAKKEGWFAKSGSKWQTIPECEDEDQLQGRYRMQFIQGAKPGTHDAGFAFIFSRPDRTAKRRVMCNDTAICSPCDGTQPTVPSESDVTCAVVDGEPNQLSLSATDLGVGDPADGIDWADLLPRTGYTGTYLIEYEPLADTRAGIERSLAHLRAAGFEIELQSLSGLGAAAEVAG